LYFFRSVFFFSFFFFFKYIVVLFIYFYQDAISGCRIAYDMFIVIYFYLCRTTSGRKLALMKNFLGPKVQLEEALRVRF